MRKVTLFSLGLLALSSCQEAGLEEPGSSVTTSAASVASYAIPVDSALSYLNGFMESSTDILSRNGGRRVVGSVTAIKYDAVRSRSASDNVDCENLVYIANFENDEGYALLAADERISDKILAITDEGNLKASTVYSAMELQNSERIIVDGYPLDGPGFFTLPEYGDEEFMNPNTVSLFDEKEQDTLVGNFDLEDDDVTYSRSAERTMYDSPEFLTSSLCVSYAMNEIKENEFFQQRHLELGLGGGSGERVETTKSGWIIKKEVRPLLTEFVTWHQSSPFNDYYPKKRKYLFFGRKQRAPAGCFPIAVAKVLAHFEYPNRFIYNGYTVNWKELKNDFESYIGRPSVASLLRGISSGCSSLYFYAGTFTFPGKAASYMKFLGLRNVRSYSYSFGRATGMLDKGWPVIIYSIPGVNIFASHSWNIDGYKVKERTILTQLYSGSKLSRTITSKETVEMVHCDFGWKGYCNGYYVSGLFKLNDPNAEKDDPSDIEKTHYNNLLKIIMYDK